MGKPSAPKPPDPKETSAAQTGTNIGTSIANNVMGQVDQFTPDGSLTYETTGTQKWKDPYTGKKYDIPQYAATTSLSETGQDIYDQNQGAKLNLASLANDRAGFLKDYLPGTEGLTDTISANLTDLARKRIDPRFEQEGQSLEAKLVNQGVNPGSEAWDRAMTQFGQDKNDAYAGLELQGRGQALTEINNPINQITALLSNSQVSNPNVALAGPNPAATTDVAGLIGQNYAQKYANYQGEKANRDSLLGGLFGLTSAGITGGMFGPGFG